MRIGPLAFPWWAALTAGALCALGVVLGNWQSDRAEEKRAITDRLADFARVPAIRLGDAPVAAEDYLWHKVEVHGEFDAQRTLLLGNRLYRGKPGYYVVTPLRIDTGRRYVLVLRGWMASGSAPPGQAVPPGMRVIRGLAVPRVARMYEPGAPGHERVRQNVDLAGFEIESALPLQPSSSSSAAGPKRVSSRTGRRTMLSSTSTACTPGSGIRWPRCRSSFWC